MPGFPRTAIATLALRWLAAAAAAAPAWTAAGARPPSR